MVVSFLSFEFPMDPSFFYCSDWGQKRGVNPGTSHTGTGIPTERTHEGHAPVGGAASCSASLFRNYQFRVEQEPMLRYFFSSCTIGCEQSFVVGVNQEKVPNNCQPVKTDRFSDEPQHISIILPATSSE